MCLNYKYFLQVKPEFDVKYKLTGVKSQFTYLCEVKDVARGSVKLNYDKERFNLIVKECGQCRICKLKRASKKACQAQCEYKTTNKGSFVTLTFGNEQLTDYIIHDKRYQNWSYYKKKKYISYLQWTLEKREITLFIKRLRKEYYFYELRNFLTSLGRFDCLLKQNGQPRKYPVLPNEYKDLFKPSKIRYILCGEYGELKTRPHYHLVIFGVDFAFDSTFARYSWKKRKNVVLHHNNFLSDLWRFGEVTVDCVNYHTCNYVARYVTKKIHNYNKAQKDVDVASHIYQGRLPEFCRQSNRPGIGFDYFVNNAKKIISDRHLYFKNMKGEIKEVGLPDYYKTLMKRFYPKEYRKYLRDSLELQLDISNRNIDEFISRMKSDAESVKAIYSQFVGNYEFVRKNVNIIKYETFNLKRQVFSDIQDISKVYRSANTDTDFVERENWRIVCFRNFERYRKCLYRKALQDYIISKIEAPQQADLVLKLSRKKFVIDLLDNPFRKDLLDVYCPKIEEWINYEPNYS